MINYCEGCRSCRMMREKQIQRDCKFNTENEGNCPCTDCLIKCICKEGCIPYCDWTDLVEGRIMEREFYE